MRYFIVTYLRKPDGKIDEQVEIAKALKERDISTASIILDFKEKRVQKSIIQGQNVPVVWDTVVAHYRQVYPDYVAELEKMHDE